MYYSNISDNEVKQFHEKIKLTAGYSELNSLDSDLFDKTIPNKCIPLFYTDEVSGNENIRILDNKIILYTDDDDLDSVYFKGKIENITFNVLAKIEHPSNYLLRLHFYDNVSLFSLAGFQFHIKQSVANGVNKDVVSDDYGNVIIPLETNQGTFTITCKETGQEVII